MIVLLSAISCNDYTFGGDTWGGRFLFAEGRNPAHSDRAQKVRATRELGLSSAGCCLGRRTVT